MRQFNLLITLSILFSTFQLKQSAKQSNYAPFTWPTRQLLYDSPNLLKRSYDALI